MIHCSSSRNNKGFITEEQCLACAKDSFPPACGMDYALLKRILAHDRWEPQEIHVSDMLETCQRKIWMSKKGYAAEYPHHKLVVTEGSAMHAYIETQADDFYQAERNVKLSYKGSEIFGTIDSLYHIEGNHYIIVDNKTTRNVKKNEIPKKQHTQQVSIYKYMIEHTEDIIIDAAYISYIDLVGPSRCPRCKTYLIPADDCLTCASCGSEFSLKENHIGGVLVEVELLADDFVEKILDDGISKILAASSSPGIPEGESSFLCRYCPFLHFCEVGQDSLW